MGVLEILIKIAALIPITGFVFMFICWPINDQETSKTQYSIFFIVMAFIIGMMFVKPYF